MPSKKRKYNARFPAGRIKKIMQTDEEVGKVAQAVPVIISRTLELFVESLLKKSMSVTLSRNAKTLSPSHVKQCILSESRFDFLRDLVKNIPDVSAAEEREQNVQSANNSPTAHRYPDGVTPHTPTKLQSQPSLPSTSRSLPTSKNRRTQQFTQTFPDNIAISNYAIEHNGKRTTDAHENNLTNRIEVPAQPEDLTRRRVPNFYQETLPDSCDSKQEVTANQSSVIQYAGRLDAPKQSATQASLETNKDNETIPKIPIDLTKPYAPMPVNQPKTPLFNIDFTRVPLQTSTSFDSALQPQPILNFDFTKNPLKPEIKYGSFDSADSKPTLPYVLNQSKSTSASTSHRSLPVPIQRSTSLVRTNTKQPPALVPIASLQMKPMKTVPVVNTMELDEDYDT